MEKETKDFGLKWGSRKRLRCMNKERNHKSSPNKNWEKEERYYTTRGSLGYDEKVKVLIDCEEEKSVLPKVFTTLSSKEKEVDFMAMKGCKLPLRPKKRAKLIQTTLLLVSPGAWLSNLCRERYQIRENNTSKKKPRGGLRAMGGLGSIQTDSE